MDNIYSTQMLEAIIGVFGGEMDLRIRESFGNSVGHTKRQLIHKLPISPMESIQREQPSPYLLHKIRQHDSRFNDTQTRMLVHNSIPYIQRHRSQFFPYYAVAEPFYPFTPINRAVYAWFFTSPVTVSSICLSVNPSRDCDFSLPNSTISISCMLVEYIP